ncbi:MAG: methyl-accepting chemotaxis protein [SAR324 cluster bacterium]|nr:methyl-accepting chemotaxis protein [SAR324 cluster bacterium]
MFQNLKIGTKTIMLFVAGLILSFLAMFFINKNILEDNEMKALVLKARAITIEAENARQYVEDLRSTHNAFDDERLFASLKMAMDGKSFASVADRIAEAKKQPAYWTIPIVVGWNIGQTNADKAHYQFKVPKVKPRNPDNEPDAFELAALTELKQKQLEEYYRVDPQTNTLRYFRPIRLTEGCMMCHGNASHDDNGDGIDPLGFKMEDWKVGDIHGAFEVIADLTPLQQTTSNSMVNTALAAVVILAVAILILFLFTRASITAPLRKTVTMLDSLATGDLTHRLNIQGKDEISQMANSMDHFADSFCDTFESIDHSSSKVSQEAQSVSRTSISLAQGATQQASSIEEISASLTEISSQTEQNAQNAAHANKLAIDMRKDAADGSKQMEEMVSAISEIDASSQDISKIIKVIDEIAFQTNLLALNAAVEAARAGSHGKGFAVVANEVRDLAVRSANAAKETTELIEKSVHKVKQGIQISDQTAEALTKLVRGIEKVSDLAGEIDAASREQASGLDQISLGMTQLEDVTQQTSRSSEQTSSASQQMANLAADLRSQTSKFKFDKGANLLGNQTKTSSSKPKPQHLESKPQQLEQSPTPPVPMPVQQVPQQLEQPTVPGNKGQSPSQIIALDDDEFGKY